MLKVVADKFMTLDLDMENPDLSNQEQCFIEIFYKDENGQTQIKLVNGHFIRINFSKATETEILFD